MASASVQVRLGVSKAMLRQIVTPEELNHRLNRGGLVVIVFTAEWNKDTENMRQLIEEMAMQYRNVSFVEACNKLIFETASIR